MLEKIKNLLNPMKWVAKLLSPGQFSSISRTILKFAAGFLIGAGFSEAAVGEFTIAAEPILSGLLALAVGVVASAVSASKQKKEE